jgi:hypothetical protein
VHEISTKKIIRILVPRGDDPPYSLDDYKIYIREETETNLAVRDEIVNLVMRGKHFTTSQKSESADSSPEERIETDVSSKDGNKPALEPQTGIELFQPEERNGVRYFTVKDLRNGNIVKNVTQTSARRLWQYAIKRYNDMMDQDKKPKIQWLGNFGMWRKYKARNLDIYDLVYKEEDHNRYFFGVTSIGLHGNWKIVTGEKDDL